VSDVAVSNWTSDSGEIQLILRNLEAYSGTVPIYQSTNFDFNFVYQVFVLENGMKYKLEFNQRNIEKFFFLFNYFSSLAAKLFCFFHIGIMICTSLHQDLGNGSCDGVSSLVKVQRHQPLV
jgi:hypothetical protein